MSVKTIEDARFKTDAATATGTRTLDFYAAAFSKTPDKQGDIIDPHAFDEWLQTFYKAGQALPISFAHSAVLQSGDPFNIIGHAPADPEHVWVDDYGLRVKGYLNMTNGVARYVGQLIDDKVIPGASMAWLPARGFDKQQRDGSRLITKVETVKEIGPGMFPVNAGAVLLGLKSMPDLTSDEVRTILTLVDDKVELKAVDSATWDANEAMGMCSSAADYRAICAAEHDIGTPDERQHWAGPHHFPGSGPNEAGVQAGLGRWGTDFASTQVGDITEAQWQRGLTHLRSHMSEINPNYEPPKAEVEPEAELKHQAAPTALQAAHDALVKAGAKCQASEGELKASVEEFIEAVKESSEPDPNAEVEARLRRIRFLETSLV